MPDATFPSLSALADALNPIFFKDPTRPGSVTIINRRPLNTTQSHPSEVVQCRTSDGRDLQVLCKCGDGAPDSHRGHGHRRGGPYEAMVYDRLLAPIGARVPHWYGTYLDDRGSTWLVLGYLDGGVPLGKVKPGLWLAAQAQGARWAAHFQNSADARLETGELSSLIKYDAEYYLGWMRRTLSYAEPIESVQPWLSDVAERYTETVVPMLLAHPTVIHGEFYSGNILLWRDEVYVLDWESAAIGAGEIDLACLLEGIKPAAAREAIEAYRRERVRPASAGEFTAALDAARLYLQFRWLGEMREWTLADSTQWRFRSLRGAAERLGLL